MRFLLLLFVSLPLFAGDAGTVKTTLQRQLDELYKDAKYPGLSFGYALPDGQFGAVSVGYSDMEARTPLKPDELMLAGSVGKIFCAAAALQLVDEGKLDLDAKVATFFPNDAWFPRLQNHETVTVRHLLTHTSGIPRYVFEKAFTKNIHEQPDRIWKPEELLSFILDKPAHFPAGEGFSYADTNYVVVGMIIERITGHAYYDEVSNRLLKPNGFKHIVASNSRQVPGMIVGYAGSKDPLGFPDRVMKDGRVVANIQFEWTGGGYAVNTAELARFGKMLYEGAFHKPETVKQMLDAVDAPQLHAKYGLGVIVREREGIISYGHSGFMPGYRTVMAYYPDLRAALAFQWNTSDTERLDPTLKRDMQTLIESYRELVKQYSH